MSIELILFYIFATIAVASAILVVSSRNVVHSAAFLGATLFAVAGLFLTLHAEFLAGVQVIVYIGGILVLFVFVIMLISVEKTVHERQFGKQWIVGFIAALLLISELIFVVWRGRDTLVLAQPVQPAQSALNLTGNSQLIGEALYTNYLLPFEI